MAVSSDRVTVFTAAMRSEFMTAYENLRPVTQTPWKSFVTMVNSTSRTEQYPWMSPPPRLKRWMGKRNYTIPDFSKFLVENVEYSAEEAFRLRDVEDIQQPLDGYKLRAAAMGADARDFPGREVMKLLRDNAVGFDGTNLFATASGRATTT
jgi:phage major head subunit gpT-like protein